MSIRTRLVRPYCESDPLSVPTSESSAAASARRSVWAELRDAIRGTGADYTKIPLRRAVFLLAVPMVLELVLESTLAVVDIYFVGRLGSSAVATVRLSPAFRLAAPFNAWQSRCIGSIRAFGLRLDSALMRPNRPATTMCSARAADRRTTDIVLEPLDFIARLAALVPPPRVHLTRLCGDPHSRVYAESQTMRT